MFARKRKTVSIRCAAVFLAALLLISLVAVIVDRNIRASKTLVNGEVMVLGVGQEYEYPVDGENLIRFKSYNKAVVDVDSNGKFTAVSKGSALVKVGTSDITVYVEDAPTAISFSEQELEIGTGEKYTPPLHVEGSDLNMGFEFESSDENVLKVDRFGKITGLSQGTASVSVQSYNGLSAVCNVTVFAEPEAIQYPVSEKTVYIGTKRRLLPSLSSGSASKTTVTESDNEEVLVTDGYTLIPVAAGKATVTATTYNGKTASCVVTVEEAPYYIRTDLDSSKPMIALSFDDGPNKPTTSSILDTLESNNASATFFMVAKRLSYGGNGDCAKRMVELGCQLGNHTYDHKHYGKDVTAQDITDGVSAIKEATGYDPTAFRPTGGYLSDTIKSNAGAPICLWSVDTNDWKYRDAQKLYDYVIYAAEDGDVILMHDIYETSAQAVEKFVPELVSRGFQIVNIAEMAYYKDVQMENGKIYSSFN